MKERLEKEKKEKERKEKEEKKRKEIIDKENKIKKEKEDKLMPKQKTFAEKKIVIKKYKEKKEPIIEKYIKTETIDNNSLYGNKLNVSKSLYDINKYKNNDKSKLTLSNVNISTIDTNPDKEKSKLSIQPKKPIKEKIIERNYENKKPISKTLNINYNKENEFKGKRIEIDLTKEMEKPDLKPKINKETNKLKDKVVKAEEYKIAKSYRTNVISPEISIKKQEMNTLNNDRQLSKDNKEITHDKKDIKVKRNNLKEIEIAKTLNNKGLDKDENRNKYFSTGIEKESKKSEMQLFKNKLKPEKESLQDISKSNIGNGKSMIVHKTNLEEERRPLKTANSSQNIYKDKREIKKNIYIREPEKKTLETEITRKIFKDDEEDDKTIISTFNQYKQGIVKKDKSINVNKNKTYKSPEETQKLEISNNYKKSLIIPSDSFRQKTEAKHIKKIYPKEETEIGTEKKDNRFISKTLKIDIKRKERINYYRIPDATNIRFMETKISNNRSQDKIRESDEEDKSMKNKTSDKERRKYLQSLSEKEIKELIKEKYMFNEEDEEEERIEKELDYDRIDKEIQNARERVERERQRRKQERIEKERPEKERRERELREKIEREENEMKLKRSNERAESERKQKDKRDKKRAESERKERGRKEKQRAESERKEKERK